MKTITMLEFRRNIPGIMRNLPQSGEILITHRGKPAARLRPPKPSAKLAEEEESLWSQLLGMAVEGDEEDATMTNEKIDQLLYGYGRPCDP